MIAKDTKKERKKYIFRSFLRKICGKFETCRKLFFKNYCTIFKLRSTKADKSVPVNMP
jgi:hypothetical protein